MVLLAERGGDPLMWDFELTADEQVTVTSIADANMQRILSVVFFGDGIQAANKQEYPTDRAIYNRCAKVAVERAVTLMRPSRVATLRSLYADNGNPVVQNNSDPQYTQSHVQAASQELFNYRQHIIANNMGYRQWGDMPRLTFGRHNPLLFMARVGLDIPLLGSIRDLQRCSSEYLEASQTLSDEVRAMVATLYHLDPVANGRPELHTFNDLSKLHGCCTPAVVQKIGKAMRRLAIEPHDNDEKKTSPKFLPVLPNDNPVKALQLIRGAISAERIGIEGRADEYFDAYSQILLDRLLWNDDCQIILQNLQLPAKNIIIKAYTAISRYANKSSSRIDGQVDRDVAIIERYLYDADAMWRDGVEEPVREALLAKPRSA